MADDAPRAPLRSVGAPDFTPPTHLSKLEVTVDGIRWRASRSIRENVFNTFLQVAPVTANLSPDGKRLYILMLGGDGAYGYFVRWSFFRHRNAKRRWKWTLGLSGRDQNALFREVGYPREMTK
jgi:hypothetical protein